jgi:hypothetical protein
MLSPLNATAIVLGALLSGASPAHAAAPKSACRVCEIALSVGMIRSDVEKKVAAALGTESQYSAYNDLDGGLVSYADGKWVLRVTYSRGTPAPWVINAQGVGEHWPPQESTVLKYELVKSRRR